MLCCFVSGLSVEFARQLCMAFAGQDMMVFRCLDRIRALRVSETDSTFRQRAVAVAESGPKSIVYFNSNQTGHIKKNCPQCKQTGGSSGSTGSSTGNGGGSKKKLVCFFCDAEGHTKQDCPEWRQLLQQKRSTAAAVCSSTADPGA